MKLLTLARDLQRRKARERAGCFVTEGIRAVESLMASSFEIHGVLATDELVTHDRGRALVEAAQVRNTPVHIIGEKAFESAASTDTPQGVLAVATIPTWTLTPPPDGPCRYLLLDAIQDPGNVGTIIRTAAAFGVTATISLPGTVDFWNAKVVRSAMGALFVHQAMAASWDAVRPFLDTHGIECWAADSGGQVLDRRHMQDASGLPLRLALAVSNEGAGLSPHVQARANRVVAIGMTDGVESLNVAVATGILLHALQPA